MIPDNDRSTPTSPADPITAMAQGAAALHELFSSYVAAGFTEDQAMDIVKAMVIESARQGGQS